MARKPARASAASPFPEPAGPFAVGDAVQLRSGGRPMTVENLTCGGTVEVVFMADCGHLIRDDLPAATLVAFHHPDLPL